MGFCTPAGKDLATNVWCVLDAAGLDGVDEDGEPQSSRERSGYRLVGHGDKVEVRYEAADELFLLSRPDGADHPSHPEHPRVLFGRRIETAMLSAITDILMAAGFGFTFCPAAEGQAAMVLVHSRSAPGIC
ncbi:hypothetical protein ACFFOP_30165 [Sinosporangium siamense]